jgi:hypothetical protein
MKHHAAGWMALAMMAMGVPLAHAQTAEDALRFSERQPITGVRSLGLGGAGFAGLADFSAMVNNPAGLGYYRNSSFSASLNFSSTEDQGSFSLRTDAGIPVENRVNATQIGHVSYVHRVPTRRGSLVVGAGINQVQSFSRELVYRGSNDRNSVTEFFLPIRGEYAVDTDNGPDGVFGTDDDVFTPTFDRDLSFIAFELFAIDLDVAAFEAGAEQPFFPAVTTGTVEQTGYVAESGSMHEVNFGGAIQAAERVMVGASLNVPVGRWELDRFATEEDVDNDNDGTGGTVNFDYLEWTQSVESRLVGVNLRVGLSD